jgi:anti-anti-sigma factor
MAKSVAPGRLELDLGDVTFIDSSGLGALISLRNAASQCGANLVVVRLSPPVARFFELAGVRDSFQVE